MQTPGSRYVQLLQGQPSANNGTVMGGLAHVLQQAMMGRAMGQERADQDAVQGRLAQALQAMQGTPENVITWNPKPDGTVSDPTVIPARPGDRSLAMRLLAGHPTTMPYAWDLATQQPETPDPWKGIDLPEGFAPIDPMNPSAGIQPLQGYTPTQEAPTVRTTNLPNGMAQDTMWNGSAWVPMGDPYPRWQPQQPQTTDPWKLYDMPTGYGPVDPMDPTKGVQPLTGYTPSGGSPNYANFTNPATGETRTVDANDPAAVQALASQGYVMAGSMPLGGSSEGPSLTQDANNQEITQARSALERLGMSPEQLIRAAQPFDPLTGLENPDYNPTVARLVPIATQRLVGMDDPQFESVWASIYPGQGVETGAPDLPGGSMPLPTLGDGTVDASKLVVGSTYDSPMGRVTWDGTQFVKAAN